MAIAVIVGIVNGGSPGRIARTLDRLLHQCNAGAQRASQSIITGRIGLAVTDPSSFSPRVHTVAGSGTLLAVSGSLFDEKLSEGRGHPDSSALLNKFLSEGVTALQSLNGDYVIAVWEEGPRRLTIVNDRFGLRRLYYWATGHRLVFAPTLSSLVSLGEFPRTVDEFALGDYLSVGHHLDGRTWYSSARALLILRAEVYRLVQGVAADSLTRSYLEAPGDGPTEKMTAVFLRQHQSNESPFDLEGLTENLRIAAPFVDRDIIEVAQVPVGSGDDPPSEHPTVPRTDFRSHCVEPSWLTQNILDSKEELLGDFFRLPKLRELINSYSRGQFMDRAKLCVLGGITLWLAAVRADVRWDRDAVPMPADMAISARA